jgi:hypothetical protein
MSDASRATQKIHCFCGCSVIVVVVYFIVLDARLNALSAEDLQILIIDTGVNVSQVSRCNIHLIENCPIESFPGYAPDRIDVEITGRAATTEEKKVFMVMIE